MEISNADRVVFPDDGITKGDVVAYYETVAEHMLPFLVGRALTVERYPKGTGAKGFMQKNAPDHLKDVIDRHEVPKEGGGTTVYPVVRDVAAIAEFANLGVITFHAPPSTVADEWHPDWVIWDLDPPRGAFELVRRAAAHLRELLRGFGVETRLMTSGSNGYHLRAQLEPTADADTVARLARGTAALASDAYPEEMTLAFRKADRGDRVFVDWLRNAPYSTSVVPWSLRARPGAPVAVPLAWDELDYVDPNGVVMAEVPERLKRDLWAEFAVQEITEAAATVDAELEERGIELPPFDRFRQ